MDPAPAAIADVAAAVAGVTCVLGAVDALEACGYRVEMRGGRLLINGGEAAVDYHVAVDYRTRKAVERWRVFDAAGVWVRSAVVR